MDDLTPPPNSGGPDVNAQGDMTIGGDVVRREAAEKEAQRWRELEVRNRLISVMGAVAGLTALIAIALGLWANQSSLRANQNAATATYALGQAEIESARAGEQAATAVAAQATAEADRARAEQQAQVALARQLAAQAQQVLDRQPAQLPRAVLLAVESLRRFPESTGSQALAEGLGLLSHELAHVTHDLAVSAAAFSPDGRWVVSGSWDNTARVWEAATGREVARLTHDGYVTAAAFSRDGRWVVSGSADGTARVWEAATGREVARLTHDHWVSAVAFSPDGRWVVSGSGDKTARVWEAATGREVARLTHDARVTAAAFSPDGQWIVSESYDGIAWVWRWRPKDLIELACARLTRNLTRTEWKQYLGEEPYRKTCENLPEGE